MTRYISIFIAAILTLTSLSAFSATTKKKITDPDEALEKARAAFYDYNPAEAREMYETYESLLKKKKKEVPADVEDEISRLVMMENMLSRVEQIAVIDSIVVDAEGFFRHYRLSPEAGRLVGGDAVRMPEVELAYVPQDNTQFLYADTDSTGLFVLMGADILDDGTVDHPAPLQGDNIAGGGNAEYPFLLSDGLTLYYSNDGDESLGGYDIFLTRRDEASNLLSPQNIGMPFNSPFDDYLMAIDDASGIGWWASDRNQIPGKVTIYVFKPSETRVNVDADNPDLVSLAKLDNIALAQKPGTAPLSQIIASIPQSSQVESKASFELPIGSTGRIYHQLSDFRSSQGRKYMAQAIDARVEIERLEARLADLRRQWADGNHNNGVQILNLEQQLDDARIRLREVTNQAIEAEIAQ